MSRPIKPSSSSGEFGQGVIGLVNQKRLQERLIKEIGVTGTENWRGLFLTRE